jgi:putative ABC transport system permease protein
MVLRENSPSPVFSQLPAGLAAKLRQVQGVRVVAPEVWGIAPSIEGRNLLGGMMSKGMQGLFDQPVIQGQDIEAHRDLKSAVYPRALREKGEGRFLTAADAGKPNIVISRKVARDYPGPDGKPRKVGDTLKIGGKPFHVIGLYETGSMILDTVIVTDIDTARALVNIPGDTVSSYYVETFDPAGNDRVSALIEKTAAGVESRSMAEFAANFGTLMGQIDKFLLMTVSLALAVGVVGIINTMLMSTSERFTEFGVLRTNGWSQADVLGLVTLESAYLGLLSGLVGCALAAAGVAVANGFFVSGGVRLTVPPWLLALGVGLSVVTGTLGGLYPAWRAARLVPMDAIRVGSH